MRHVGNDIVDLTHAQTTPKSRDARFLERVFSPEEEGFLKADSQPEAMLWALWTAKEASYKALQKERREISSAPRLYKVQLTQESATGSGKSRLTWGRRFSGVVSTPAGDIHLSTLIAPDYVHSIAVSFLPATGIMWNVERMPGERSSPTEESSYVRAAAISCLAQYLAVSPGDIEIIRHRGKHGLGPPQLYVRGQAAAIDLSLSHDGAYAAYAFAFSSQISDCNKA